MTAAGGGVGLAAVALAKRMGLYFGSSYLIRIRAYFVDPYLIASLRGIEPILFFFVTGAIVIASASSDEKLSLASQHGADYTVNYVKTDLREACKNITGGIGVEAVVEMCGGDVFQSAFKSLAWGGRLCVVGFASKDIPTVNMGHVLVKNVSVVGLWRTAYEVRTSLGNCANIHPVCGLLERLLTFSLATSTKRHTDRNSSVRQARPSLAGGQTTRYLAHTLGLHLICMQQTRLSKQFKAAEGPARYCRVVQPYRRWLFSCVGVSMSCHGSQLLPLVGRLSFGSRGELNQSNNIQYSEKTPVTHLKAGYDHRMLFNSNVPCTDSSTRTSAH